MKYLTITKEHVGPSQALNGYPYVNYATDATTGDVTGNVVTYYPYDRENV